MKGLVRPLGSLAAAWLALAACAAAPRGDEALQLVQIPIERAPYSLCILARPSGSWPVPAGFSAAEAAFARGGSAYARGAYREAASIFMEAAAALRLPEGEHCAGRFAINRIWAYRNAAYAWGMANALDEGRRRLGEAAAEDPASAPELRKIAAELPALMNTP
jgi:hypothetical protein